MIIILTMRLTGSWNFYGKNDHSVDEERSDQRGALKGCSSGGRKKRRKRTIKYQDTIEGQG